MICHVTLKLNTVIESDNIEDAMSAAQQALTIPHLFQIDGEASARKSPPRWWRKPILTANRFRERVNEFILDNYIEDNR